MGIFDKSNYIINTGITGTRRRDHISPVLQQLHWLPVHQHIKFKLAVLVYKSLYGLPPQYLVEDCELVAAAELVVPRTNTRLCDRAFCGCWTTVVEQPSVQPTTVRPYLLQFRRALKTYLFGWLRLQHLVTFVYSMLCKCFYLLTYLLIVEWGQWTTPIVYSSIAICSTSQQVITPQSTYCVVMTGVHGVKFWTVCKQEIDDEFSHTVMHGMNLKKALIPSGSPSARPLPPKPIAGLLV